MKTYIAFLRGINISGKNKIAMSDLKLEFEKLGYADVKTYLNSGNVLFSTEVEAASKLRYDIEKMICDKMGLEIPVYVIARDEILEILQDAPKWWGTDEKEKYHNMIFILSEDTPEEISHMIGPVLEGMEQVQICENIIFWTFDRKTYQKCNWWKKTASEGIAEKLTIRTANTIYKMCK